MISKRHCPRIPWSRTSSSAGLPALAATLLAVVAPLVAPLVASLVASLAIGCLPSNVSPEDAAPPLPTRFRCTGKPAPCADLTPKTCAVTPGCRPIQRCDGAPAPCDHLLQASCPRQSGCHWTLRCMGQATTCNALPERGACERQRGCAWRAEERRCAGEPAACDAMGLSSCGTQRGCYVGGACRGEAQPCEGRQGLDCERQRGCRAIPACAGLPSPCESQLEAETCASVPGCQWREATASEATASD